MPGYNTAGEEGAAPITLEPRGQPEGEGWDTSRDDTVLCSRLP